MLFCSRFSPGLMWTDKLILQGQKVKKTKLLWQLLRIFWCCVYSQNACGFLVTIKAYKIRDDPLVISVTSWQSTSGAKDKDLLYFNWRIFSFVVTYLDSLLIHIQLPKKTSLVWEFS